MEVMERVGEVGVEPVVAVGGPRREFGEFYEQRYAPMVRLAWSLVDVREVAEEVVQDAFAAMYSRYGTVRDPDAYLRTCVVNNCRKVLRRRRLVRRLRPSPAPVSVDDAHDHVFDAIGRLPRRQREVVVLRYQQGLTDADIAATLGVPVGTVKSALSRAKQQLREELAP